MEGKTRQRQRAPRVLRTFNPTRLQDDLLAAAYERLLHVGVRARGLRDEGTQPQLEGVPAENRKLAKTGGARG
jgi:hypothetical protein